MNKFKIGDKVVCVNSKGWEHSDIRYGCEYTITDKAYEGQNGNLYIKYAEESAEDFELVETSKHTTKHKHYFKDCPYDKVDVYRVLEMFNVTDACIQHATKKLLVAGGRGHKDIGRDIQDVIDTLERWKEMRKEENV